MHSGMHSPDAFFYHAVGCPKGLSRARHFGCFGKEGSAFSVFFLHPYARRRTAGAAAAIPSASTVASLVSAS